MSRCQRPPFDVPPELRSWAEIDLSAVRHNLGVVRNKIGSKPGILAVVKANAYGHGTVPIVRALAGSVSVFGVASLPEALEIAQAGVAGDIMLLSPCLPAERKLAVDSGFIVTVSSPSEVRDYTRHGPVRLNFKVDSGMGRVGVWQADAPDALAQIPSIPNARLHSISTHLPSSDEDLDFTAEQLRAFDELTDRLRKHAPGALIHSLNSAGIHSFPSHAKDLVRAGLVLYGSSPLPDFEATLAPVLSWKARVTLVREIPAGTGISYGRTFLTRRATKTAIVPVGYADGLPRRLSGNGGSVLLGGVKCPILGRVTMDQIVVDVSDAETVREGDEAVLIGRQGNEQITAGALAAQAGTIAWEIFTGIQERVVRIYGG